MGVPVTEPRLQPFEAGPGAPQAAQAGPPDEIVVAADGYRLPLWRWGPADARAEAVVLALHGFNDYANAFAGAGPFWAELGIVTYAYDQRGFGATREPGIWAGSETLVADLGTVARLIRERHPRQPLFLVGESMGGAVILTAMAGIAPPLVEGVVLISPAVWTRDLMPFYQRWALWLARALAPGMPLSGRGLDIQASDNMDLLRALGRDPLVLKETRVDTVAGLVDLMSEAYAAAPELPPPALLLFGERDEIVPRAPIEATLERLPDGRHRVAFYPEGWHMLLRDLQGEVVLRDIAAWVRDPATPLPSGLDGYRPGPLAEATAAD